MSKIEMRKADPDAGKLPKAVVVLLKGFCTRLCCKIKNQKAF